MEIKIKKIHKNAKIPKKAHNSDACYDVYATSKKTYEDGRVEYGLGFALEVPDGYHLQLFPRSSIHKYGFILSNSVGIGDSGYIGEYKAVFYKIIPSLPDYEVGDRILQIQIPNVFELDFIEVDELLTTERGEGGFGSSGVK